MAGLLDDTTIATTTADPTGGDGGTGTAGAASGGDDIVTRIAGLLGRAVGGGSAGVATLSPDQEKAANTRSLLNFGIALMANASPTWGAPRSAGSILASGLAAGEASRDASEEAASSRQQLGFQQTLDTAKQNLAQTLGLGTLGVSQGELTLKQQELAYKMALLRQQQQAGASLMAVLTGKPAPQAGAPAAPAGGAPPAGGSAATGGTAPWLANMALPAPTADASTFADPATRAKIIAVAQQEGVDPNVALAYALRESGGNPAVPPGDGGRSRGAFQIGAPEAASVGVTNPDDPDQNILAGVRYIKQLQNDPKYGANPETTLLAYAAGKGAADGVLAGQRAPPPAIAQDVANLRAVQAQNPAGLPAAGGAPGAAPGGPGYVASSGERTGILPGAAPAAGSVTPDIQASIAALPPDLRQLYATRLAAAAGDPGQTADVMKDVANAVTEIGKRPRYQVMSQADAQKQFGTAYDPTAIYETNLTDGSTKVTQQGQHPVNLADTPEAKAAGVALQMAQKRLEGLDAAAQTSSDALGQLAVMKPLAQMAGSANQVFAQYPQVLNWMRTLGIGTQAEIDKWTAGQALDAVANYMAFENKPAGIQRLSNFDLQRLLTSVPSMGDTPQTRELKIAILQNTAQRRIAENSFAQNYFMQNHNLAGLDDAMQAKLGTGLPHAPPVANMSAATPAEVSAFQKFRGTLGDGDLFFGPDGSLRINRAAPGR